jgi:hypothetical protein
MFSLMIAKGGQRAIFPLTIFHLAVVLGCWFKTTPSILSFFLDVLGVAPMMILDPILALSSSVLLIPSLMIAIVLKAISISFFSIFHVYLIEGVILPFLWRNVADLMLRH